ncbi:hypothetical protein Tco_0990649 [Tanacetum coccineum]|uniref:Uncharacterized protein n=1 Tax=Tanacetum coccineum TaxID=301880 RepID=A0ABQ5EXC9_9ASTR
MLLMQAQESGAVLDEEQSLFLAGEQVTNVDDDVDDSQENDLALNVDHIFEADECDAFDSDVDEGPTSQTMFMANLTSEDPIYDEAGPSYDSNNPFEVQDHDAFVDHMDEYHDVHEITDGKTFDNEELFVHVMASSVRNDALMSILDEMHEQGVQSRLTNKPDMLMNDSVTSELARYKELVGEYEKRAKFELTDRERKIDEQMRIIISDRNRKETSLKSELHSARYIRSLCMTTTPLESFLNKEETDAGNQKAKLSDNSLNRDKQIWNQKDKMRRNSPYENLIVVLMEDHRKKFVPLGEICQLTKLLSYKSVLWYLTQAAKTLLTGKCSKLMNFVEVKKVHLCLSTIDQDAPVNKCFIVQIRYSSSVKHQENCRRTHSRRHFNHSRGFFLLQITLSTGDPGSSNISYGEVNAAEPNQVNYPPDHLRRWTKDHPLDNIVGNPSRPVSTRKQLASDA